MIDAALWSLFVGLLAGALFFAWPRPPGWDPVLFHTMVLSTLHRGELESAGKVLADWQARIASALPVGPRPPSGGWTEDPELLGREYDPALRIGTACGWEALAAASKPAHEAIARRLADTVCINIGAGVPDLPLVTTHHLEQADAAAANALAPAPAQRLVLVTSRLAAEVVRMLLDHPRLRDRTRAVIFFGAEWHEAINLTQVALDTELDRTTPWFFLRSNQEMSTPPAEPPVPPSGRRSVQFFDLGQLPPAELSSPHLARSLAVLLAAV